MLRLAPALTLAILLAPIGAGLVGTLLPAFGYLPALGRSEFGLGPWRELFATPGIGRAVALTIGVGFGTTLVSFLLAAGSCALFFERGGFRRFDSALAPLLATPHLALAIGFAFVAAPSGWLARIATTLLTGGGQPPSLVTIRDPYGLSFVAGLVLKETPYLVLMMIAASHHIAARPMMAAARSLGYAAPTAWIKVVLPLIYAQIRLPIYAVLAFSLSVVDVALVLAPGTPPPLAVLATRWFAGYDLALYFPAAAAASLQLVLVVAGIVVWRLAETVARSAGRRWIARGTRRGWPIAFARAAGGVAGAAAGVGLASLAALAVWSLAQDWRFPDPLPSRWTLSNWSRVGSVGAPVATTLAIGALGSAIAVALTLACLEHEQRSRRRPGAHALWLVYTPLLVPQIAFLFGTQVLLVRSGLDGTLPAVVWAHLLFVFPYVFLSLADPYRALDSRYAQIAAGLGSSPAATFWRVKIPMLARPLLTALAVGFAVSVGLYLPTLFAGAGRVATLATESVTLAGGADRRLVGVVGIVQAGLPLVAYALALALPVLIFRNRRGLR